MKELSQAEMILLAAATLDAPFACEALIVAAWGKYPDTFGMKGFKSFPCSNKVIASLAGENGLVKRGWLTKVGQKLYAVSEHGRTAIQWIAGGKQSESVEAHARGGLSAVLDRFLRAKLESDAFRKFESGKQRELSFADAFAFWQFDASVRGVEVSKRIAVVTGAIRQLGKVIGDDMGQAQTSTGRIVKAGDVRALMNMHSHMEDKFERHLELLRKR